MRKTTALRKSPMVAAVKGAKELPATVRFDYLNETPGAWRYQESSIDGTPLVSDADGAKIGALYLRKAAFPVAPKSITVVVS